MKANLRPLKNEKGSVLLTGLIVLIVLTLIGLAGMQTTTLEERMTANTANRNLAFMAAEASLRQGETLLEAAVLPAFTGNGYYTLQPNLWQTSSTWSGTASVQYAVDLVGGTGSGAGVNLAARPRYYIEELGTLPTETGSLLGGTPMSERTAYRVTARGVGGTTTTEVILQTIFIR